MGRMYSEAMLALAEANFSYGGTGDFAKNQQQEVRQKSFIRIDTSSNNVAGVVLPEFQLRGVDKDKLDDKEMLGLTEGGQAITKC